MTWLWYALASVLFFTAQDLLMRVLAIKTTQPRIFSVVFNLWGSLFAIIVFMSEGGSFDSLRHLTPLQYGLLASTILLYGFYERFNFSARKAVNASTLSIIYRMSPVIAFAGSILFLHEPMSVHKAFGAALAIGASFLLVYKNPHLSIKKTLSVPLLCMVLLGIAWVADKPASAAMPASLYSFMVWCVPLFFVMFPGVSAKQVRKEFVVGGWKVAVAALLNVVGYICNIQALALADASRVIPVVATNGIFIVLGGIILLHEHEHARRKYIAAALAFAGVLLLR
jgi:drug/metabolite transporter (DMT)-like permease